MKKSLRFIFWIVVILVLLFRASPVIGGVSLAFLVLIMLAALFVHKDKDKYK